ncbi:MAG: xanthine dehydrogenase family protein molybdopterin-binding subunit [Clostridiales bacterium]|nr:xanthine dehydrogenase family protein molybdopterin-binding subunit [Clostridiales bacterium]
MPLQKIGEKGFNIINQSKPRIDGVEKVTGRARYAADYYMDNMLYAGVLRSKYPSARVVSINADKARAIEGVEAVVTCFEIPKKRSWAMYHYLTDRVRYAGDCVAMVAAESQELVDEALEAIEVEYEELPGCFTIEEALAPDAPTVNDEYPDNIFTPSHFKLRKGDVEKGFAEADLIVEREYTTQFIEHSYIEPEAVIAYEDPNEGVMTVRASSQNPFFSRRYIADILGVPMNKCRLIQEFVGGTFGGKEEGVGVMIGRASWLAHITHRPVKLVFSREDSFLESSKRHPFKLHYKAGVKKDGTLVAFEGTQIDNCGAYNNQTQFMNWRASVHSMGPYVCPNVKTDTFGVFTNNIHGGAMRGYSSPQLIFGQEQFYEEVAEELGMDYIDFKRKNLLDDGKLSATGTVCKDVTIKELMERTIEQTDYQRKHEEYKNQTSKRFRKGIGICTAYRGCGLGNESPDASGTFIIANADGSVMVNTGTAENGQGLRTAFSQIAAEALGVRYEDVAFYGTDTHTIADSGMTVASRGTVMGAQSVKKAAEKLKEIMLNNCYAIQAIPIEEVEDAYGLDHGTMNYAGFKPHDIELRDSEFFFKRYPKVKIPFSKVTDICTWGGRPLAAYEWYMPRPLYQDHETGQGEAFPTYSYEVVVAEVEVDTRTGYVDVTKVTASHDVGTAINPALIAGQIYGGIAMGQGFVVTEDVAPNKGIVKNKNFDNYIIPTAMDVPEMTVNIFENANDSEGTFGAKSVGEPATEAIGAAIANAVYNATGRRIRNNPCDLESVLLGHKLTK